MVSYERNMYRVIWWWSARMLGKKGDPTVIFFMMLFGSNEIGNFGVCE